MDPRQINVIVTEGGRCPLLKVGDSLAICDNEIQMHSGKMCMRALDALYVQLPACLRAASPKEVYSQGPLHCSRAFCGVTFRVEILPAGSSKKTPALAESSTSNARRAAIAGAMLQNLGSFMERVPSDVSSRLMRSSTVQTFQDGQTILAEGELNDKLFIVGDGEVCLTRRFPLATEDSFLAVLGVGECFGEMALLTEQANQITVRAHPSATIYTVPQANVNRLMNTSAYFNLAMSQMLADRLRVFLATIEEDVRPGMRGDLATIPVVDLVQALNASRRCGTLILSNGPQDGRIVFAKGKLIGAALGAEFGEDVFYEMAAWKQGNFSFETKQDVVEEAQRVTKDTLNLLMEFARRTDESGRPRQSSILRKSGLHKPG